MKNEKHHKHRSEVIFESCCETSGAIRYWIPRRTVGSLTRNAPLLKLLVTVVVAAATTA